jgi:hypothetical protein
MILGGQLPSKIPAGKEESAMMAKFSWQNPVRPPKNLLCWQNFLSDK